MTDLSRIEEEAERVINQGGVGNAPSYKNLLRYLAKRAADESQLPPKEVEIAQDVFGKSGDISTTDSSTRVYIHNLRGKLVTFYSDRTNRSDYRLSIPPGGYSLELTAETNALDDNKDNEKEQRSGFVSPVAVTHVHKAYKPAFWLSLCGIALMAAVFIFNNSPPSRSDTLNSSANLFWDEMIENAKPIIIVPGDTFFFVEDTGDKETTRVVHNLYLDSYPEFTDYLASNPLEPDAKINRYPDTIQFVSRSTSKALILLVEKYTHSRPLEYKMASEITANDLREKNVIFVGQFRTQQNVAPIYQRIPIEFHDDYRHFTLTNINEVFSQIGKAFEVHKDYGLYTQYTGHEGNRIITFGSIQDTSLARMVRFVTDNESYAELIKDKKSWPDMAAVFEVTGFNRSDVDARMIHQFDLQDGES